MWIGALSWTRKPSNLGAMDLLRAPILYLLLVALPVSSVAALPCEGNDPVPLPSGAPESQGHHYGVDDAFQHHHHGHAPGGHTENGAGDGDDCECCFDCLSACAASVSAFVFGADGVALAAYACEQPAALGLLGVTEPRAPPLIRPPISFS